MGIFLKLTKMYEYYKFKNMIYKHCEYVTDNDIEEAYQRNDFAQLMAIELLARSGMDLERTKRLRIAANSKQTENTPNNTKTKLQDPAKSSNSFIPKNSLTDLLIDEILNSDIFIKEKHQHIIDVIKTLKYPDSFRWNPPLLSNEEKKSLNIQYRGNLSVQFYESLNPNHNLKESIERYDNLIRSCQLIEHKNQALDRKRLQIDSAKEDRLRTIEVGFTQGIWRCAPEQSAPKCNHKQFDNKIFILSSGLYCELTGRNEFPGESIDCNCHYQLGAADGVG